MYIVVYSSDPYLLARLATDLQMEGIENTDPINGPFNEALAYMWIYKIFNEFELGNYEGCGNPFRMTITSRNYLQTLTTILEAK